MNKHWSFTHWILLTCIFLSVLVPVALVFLRVDIAVLLPLQPTIHLPNEILRIGSAVLKVIFYVTMFMLIRKESNPWVLVIFWFTVVMYNIAPVGLQLYNFITWIEPPPLANDASPNEVVLYHISYSPRENILYRMIIPAAWLIVGSLLLVISIRDMRKKTGS